MMITVAQNFPGHSGKIAWFGQFPLGKELAPYRGRASLVARGSSWRQHWQ